MAGPTAEEPIQLDIRLDRRSPVPLYLQLSHGLEAAIAEGRLRPGMRLENEVALAQRLGLSRPTARQGIQELVDKGLVVRRRGVGTQVVHSQVNRPVALTSLWDDLVAGGKSPTTTVLEYRVGRPSAEAAEALGEEVDGQVLELTRLRSSAGQPLALMTNYLPGLLAPSLEDLQRQGLYACLRDRGVRPVVAHERIGARATRPEEAELLDEAPGAPLLTLDRTSHDDRGRLIEYGRHVYRASHYSFEVTLFDR